VLKQMRYRQVQQKKLSPQLRLSVLHSSTLLKLPCPLRKGCRQVQQKLVSPQLRLSILYRSIVLKQM